MWIETGTQVLTYLLPKMSSLEPIGPPHLAGFATSDDYWQKKHMYSKLWQHSVDGQIYIVISKKQPIWKQESGLLQQHVISGTSLLVISL
jgi:hypothetical protein